MHIESLYLKQYRNYEELTLQFENKINVIIGENAQGKTNLMEAIYVLAFTKSHRTPREKELINWMRILLASMPSFRNHQARLVLK